MCDGEHKANKETEKNTYIRNRRFMNMPHVNSEEGKLAKYADGVVLLCSSSRFFCCPTSSMVKMMRTVRCLRRCGRPWQSFTMTCCFTVVRSLLFTLKVWLIRHVFFYIWFLRAISILQIGIHIEHEEEEEEVDTSLRGRLLSLVDKIKNLRKKKEEEKPEVEEEPKPSKIISQITC